ncbi:BTB/POZ domain-containing protein 6-like isoform X2 [Rhodnius prolixus]|uniref:BTB/POZ domain-containing protein 6-like isoform X2 n=1 Tax=Rhodnius prolixus TaxID=13249 RepID=UPI003D18D9C3
MNWGQKQQDWQVTKSSLKERFKELLLLSQWTDCTFSVGEDNTEIKCHKLVLAVSSPVFEALFFGGLSDPLCESIRVPDIEPHIFKMLLMYMYSDSLNLHNIEEAGNLLYAAKKYLMPQLSRLCLEYLLDRTCIQTLWDILTIAESLDEEELIEAVLKIMCRFGRHVWYSKAEHLSAAMLKRLLSESSMNMSEEELWSVTLDWAHKDCLDRGVKLTGRHLRDALQRERLLEGIRFLVFNGEKFKNEVVRAEVLTDSEVNAICRMIKEQQLDQNGSTVESTTKKSYELPEGICALKKKRRRVSRVIWRCTREKVKGDSMWICCDQFVCTVVSNNLVLVTGLEVPTRSIYSARECYPWLGSLQHPTGTYNERFSVAITDQDGTVLVSTSYDARVPYDSIQIYIYEKKFSLPGMDKTKLYKYDLFTDTLSNVK